MKPFTFLESSSPEWVRAWAQLKARYGDVACFNSVYAERWQYMGTVEIFPGRIVHQFRHRALPPTNERTYFEAEASRGFILNGRTEVGA